MSHVRIRPFIALAIVSTGCLVTRAPNMNERPRWRHIGVQAIETPCASGRAFVRKSGKQGVGLTLMWKSRGDCKVAIESVHIAFDPQGTNRVSVPIAAQTVELPGRSLRYTWLPVAFDNQLAWNNEHNTAAVELALVTTPGERTTWRISMEQR